MTTTPRADDMWAEITTWLQDIWQQQARDDG